METSIFTQVVQSLVASGTMVSSGMNVAFTGVAQPSLKAPLNGTSDLRITDQQGSWVASLPHLTMIIGSLIAGPTLEKYGRRIGLILSTFPAAVGWILMGVGPGLWSLYLGRLLTGLSMGFTGPSCSVFVAEISSPSTRSALTVVKTIAFSLGLTLTFIFGYFYKTEWRVVSLLCGVFPIGCLLLILGYVPETQVWKAKREEIKSKKRAADLEEIKDDPDCPPGKRGGFTKMIFRPQVVKPMIIMNVILFLRQMSGTSAIFAYAVELVVAAGVRQDPFLISVLLGLTRLLGSLLAVWLSAHLGRRIPVAYSGVSMSAAMLGISSQVAYPPAVSISADDRPQFMSAFFLLAYILSSTVFSAVPQAMIGEVFPTQVRGISASVTSFTMYSTAFVSVLTYPHLLNRYGRSWIFTFYGVLCVVATVFSLLFLPETHGKTLNEIERMFNKKCYYEDYIAVSSDIKEKKQTRATYKV